MALTQDSTSGWLLDTHALIWLRAGTLTAKPDDLEVLRLAAKAGAWFICSFSLSEIAYAVSRKRLLLDRPLPDWFHAALRRPGPGSLDITPEVAAATAALPATFHGDPGDRILAATAIVHNLTICTHDDLLLKFSKQGLYKALKVSEIKET